MHYLPPALTGNNKSFDGGLSFFKFLSFGAPPPPLVGSRHRLTIHMVRPGRDSTKGPVGTHYSYGEGEEQLSFGGGKIEDA